MSFLVEFDMLRKAVTERKGYSRIQFGKLNFPVRKKTSVNFKNELELATTCPLAAALTTVGGRWKPLLVYYIGRGLTRYSVLQQAIPRISSKMLYQQLRELEADGLISRVVQVNRKVHYALTDAGTDLLEPLESLEKWGRQHGIRRKVP